MKREQVNYVAAGGFVLVTGVALLVTLLTLMGRSGPTDTYFVYYRAVAGMKFGTVVRYQGYRIGQVEDIEPIHSGRGVRYKVTVAVHEGWPVKQGSVARVATDGLISAVSIDIRGGTEAGLIAPGSEIPGQAAVDMFSALREAAEDFRSLSADSLRPLAETLNREIPPILADIRALTHETLRPLAENLRDLTDDPELFANIKRLIVQMDEVAGRINEFLEPETLARTRELLRTTTVLSAELVETNRRVQSFLDEDNRVRVESTLAGMSDAADRIVRVAGAVESVFSPDNRRHVGAILTRLDATVGEVSELTERLGETRQRLDAILVSVGRLVDDNEDNVNHAMGDLRTSLEVLASHVQSFAYHLEGSSQNLHEFTRLVRENPGLLLRGSPQRDPAPAAQ